MRLNRNTALASRTVLLVPYEAHHVPTYHAWLESEELRDATASERLTLEEEYEMQRSWREGPDKLTFVICHPLDGNLQKLEAKSADSPEKMVGDVNLFLYDQENEGQKGLIVGEIELMIARVEHRGKGLGRAVLLLFLWYLVRKRSELAKSRGEGDMDFLTVKINQSNVRSIRLFESMGFRKTSNKPNYFGEFEMQCGIGEVEDLVKSHEAEEEMREMEYQQDLDGEHEP